MERLQLRSVDDDERLLDIEGFDAPRLQDKELRMKDLHKNLCKGLHMRASPLPAMDPEREQPSKEEVGNEPSQPDSFLADCDEEDLQSETVHCESKRRNNSLDARKEVSVCTLKSSPIPIRRSRRGHTSQDAPKKLELDQDNQEKVETHFPFFFVEMKRSNVIAGFWLTIPSEFSCKHLPNNDGPIILRDTQGLKWDTKYLARRNALSAGWNRFAVDHRLELGDALVFELVKPLEFLVHITRVSKCEGDAAAVTAATSNKAPDSNSPHMHSSPRKRMKVDNTQDKAVDQKRVTTRSSQTRSQEVNVHSLFHVKTRRRGSGRF